MNVWAERWYYNDGGRAAAGFKGETSDCVVRSITIATGRPYREVYDELQGLLHSMRQTKLVRASSPRLGVHKPIIRRYLDELGWVWTPTMKIGQGTTVHLRADELPDDERLIVSVSKHTTTMIHGIIHDTSDPSREGTRAVYGYWKEG